jgi:DNA polymerase I-like protein with 3'-5' exonuclease and polymerase domains
MPTSNAKNLHLSVEVMKHFQSTYMKKFSGIKRMHTDVARELQTESQITTPLGRKRLFFGRGYEDDILRKGVAYRPQSGVGDLLNLGMWRVWKYMQGEVQLLGQLHDAILIQYDDDPAVERRVIACAIALMTIPVMVTDVRLRGAETREMVIPVDASVGWNWAKVDKRDAGKNPDGLLTYKGGDKRRRLVSPSTELLKRVM